uniref:Minor capsid protein L2 n=1 Tax=Barbastella barbastellus papillomavirus 1 TaxID=3139985 RepID=A0AAU6S4Y4_9PAPI
MLRRRKRASVQDIYRDCKRFGTCPPDVINKVERNTIADKILKYGSGVVYFGGLGIGTGKGTAGTSTGINVGRGIGSFRPTIPIDTIGPIETPLDPVEVTPIDVSGGGNGAILPTDPSVIDLETFPVATEEPDVIQPPPPTVVEEEILIPPGPAVDAGADPAIIEVTPDIPHPNRISRTQYNNPAFDVVLTSNNRSGELSSSDHIIVGGGGGELVGQRIPLVEFTSRPDTSFTGEQAETSFYSSTPITYRPRVPPPLGGRRFQQVEVAGSTFLREPGRLVTFDFVNPAYEAEVTQIFEQDLEDVAAAPDPAFQDIVRLGRVQYGRAPSGGVRVSRIGQRGTIRTRSGTQIGSHVHFYQDLSAIGEPVELPIPGEQSLEASLVQAGAEEGYELVNLGDVSWPVDDDDLIDTYDEVQALGNNAQLSFNWENGNEDFISVPLEETRKPGGFIPDIHLKGYTVNADRSHRGRAGDIIPADTPYVIINPFSDDFDLHPSLLRKRRRRRKYVIVY